MDNVGVQLAVRPVFFVGEFSIQAKLVAGSISETEVSAASPDSEYKAIVGRQPDRATLLAIIENSTNFCRANFVVTYALP
ncbi:MAG: hypothetical protein A2X94_15635 [Bdellovibrionales bacterium GWB1_55_8]|nr:MAG: hypothetical protein A2X94_15635 [Bdellovibrionales bacterium GWB1_55_8]